MLRPFAHLVACCCVLSGVVAQSLKPVKRLAPYKWTYQLPTLLGQQCWELLRSFARSLSRSPEGFHTNKTDNQTVFLLGKDIRGRAWANCSRTFPDNRLFSLVVCISVRGDRMHCISWKVFVWSLVSEEHGRREHWATTCSRANEDQGDRWR